ERGVAGDRCRVRPSRRQRGVTTSAKPLVGYTDRISAHPGETVQFMISCELEAFDAQLVRLGAEEQAVRSSIDGHHGGRFQPLHHGSYVVVSQFPAGNLA